jgi:hypothetical protein
MATPRSRAKEEATRAVRAASEVPPPPPRPVIPPLFLHESVDAKIDRIQNFISSFEYNYTGQPYIRLKRNLGMLHLTASARKLIRLAYPIQCVEAVFLAVVLTSFIEGIDRIPLSFKSKLDDSVHRHIVLALRHEGKWGAVGISRRENLMYKPLVFESLTDLISEFKISYDACYHSLTKVYVGLPFSRNCFTEHPIKWRAVSFRVVGTDTTLIQEDLELYLTQMHRARERYELTGKLELSLQNHR